jgi:hypothetical protein
LISLQSKQVYLRVWLSTTQWRRYGGAKVQFSAFLITTLKWSASSPGSFTLWERASGNLWTWS